MFIFSNVLKFNLKLFLHYLENVNGMYYCIETWEINQKFGECKSAPLSWHTCDANRRLQFNITETSP